MSKPPKEVWIRVSLQGVISAHPNRVCVSKGAEEEVAWRCFDGDVEIRFTRSGGGTPFHSGAFPLAKGGGALSGPVRGDAKEGVYKYTVVVTVPGLDANEQPDPLDPEVQVDP